MGKQVAFAPKGSEPPLVMASPDSGAVYRLDPGLPLDAQRIEVRPARVRAQLWRGCTLLVDGRPLARFSAPPYSALWQLEPGLHAFSAEAVDVTGQRLVSDEVWVEVRH